MQVNVKPLLKTYYLTVFCILCTIFLILDIVTTISKLSKECVLRIAEDKLYFIVSDDNNAPAPPILWCEIPQTMFFSEYQMVGLDDDHKDIYLGFGAGKSFPFIIRTK